MNKEWYDNLLKEKIKKHNEIIIELMKEHKKNSKKSVDFLDDYNILIKPTYEYYLLLNEMIIDVYSFLEKDLECKRNIENITDKKIKDLATSDDEQAKRILENFIIENKKEFKKALSDVMERTTEIFDNLNYDTKENNVE